MFHLKKKFQNFFLNFYPKSFPDIKNRNGFSKTGHLKILIRFEKKSIFRQVLHLEKKFRIFFLNIYPKSFPDTKNRNGFLTWGFKLVDLIWNDSWRKRLNHRCTSKLLMTKMFLTKMSSSERLAPQKDIITAVVFVRGLKFFNRI